MKRVLAIPLEEVREHFALNSRQDVKMVAPEILAGELIAKLKAAGQAAETGATARGRRSGGTPRATLLMRCVNHANLPPDSPRNRPAPSRSASPMKRARRTRTIIRIIWKSTFPNIRWKRNTACDANSPIERVKLEKGGALIFAAGVVHRARLGGMTVVIEIPAVKDDKVVVDL